MKFLENQPPIEEEKKEPKEVIQVIKLMKLSLDCNFCDTYQDMQGGPVGDGKAKFQCPDCKNINTIEWKLDL